MIANKADAMAEIGRLTQRIEQLKRQALSASAEDIRVAREDYDVTIKQYSKAIQSLVESLERVERERDDARKLAEHGRLGQIRGNQKFPWENA